MRYLSLLIPVFFVFLYSVSPAQKSWQVVGSKGFSAGTDQYQNIAFSSSDTPYIVYREELEKLAGATVKMYDGSQWVTVGRDSFSTGGALDPSLSFPPSSNTPYVAYMDEAHGSQVTVEKFNGSQWVSVGSDTFSQGSTDGVDLAFPPSSATPYVAYKDGNNGDAATVEKYDGSQWVYVGNHGFSDGQIGSGSISLAFSSAGTPYVAYADGANGGGTTVKKFNGSSWVTVGTDTFSDNAAYQDIEFPPSSNTPYVAYNNIDFTTAPNGATVQKFDGSQWTLVGAKGFPEGSPGPREVSLAFLPSSSTPYVAFANDSDYLTVRKFDGSQWVPVGNKAFSDGKVKWPSIAFHSSGMPYVAFQDEANGRGPTVMKYDEGTSVREPLTPVPTRINPNPFTHTTSIQYTLSQSTAVQLTIYDVRGQQLKDLRLGRQSKGAHRYTLDLSEADPGLYLYHLQTNNGLTTGKMIITE